MHSSHSIQPMHFLLVSRQLDDPFLRYGLSNVSPCKNTSEILEQNSPQKVYNRMSPNSNQVINMKGDNNYTVLE